jgi:ABC-type Fe3+/spermidine/putrescine transport system ATPase subunit
LTNLAKGQIVDEGRVASAWGEITSAKTDERQPGDKVTVLIRPEAAKLVIEDPPPVSRNAIRGTLVASSFRGGRYRVQVQPEKGPRLTLEFTAVEALPRKPGDQVTILLDPAGVVLLSVID